MLLLLCVSSLTIVGGVQAGIYRWVDADGQVQLSDRPPPKGGAEEVRLPPINTYRGVSVEDFRTTRSDRPSGGKAKKVLMYSASWCSVCTRARRYFRAEGIPFRELDVDKSRVARRQYERMNAKGVPVILVGGKRMNGFSVKRFLELYR
jgi:glutaredoxin